MAQTIQLKRSATAGNKPTSSDLALGEIAINTADGAVYIKKGNNDIVAVHDNDILHIDTSNSRVGIGTTSPSYNLDVNPGSASAFVRFKGTHSSLMLDRSSTSYDANIMFMTGGTTKWRLWNDGSDNTLQIRDEVNSANVMTWEAGGDVGIGTDSPQDKLHVALDSSTTNAEVEVIRVEATSSGTPAVGFGSFIDFRGDRQQGGPDSYGRLGFEADAMTPTTVDGAFVVQTAEDGTYSERMRISSGGNVGIKNSSPDSQYFNTLVVGDTSGEHGITIQSSATSRGVLAFSDTNSATSGRYDGYIGYNHNSTYMSFHTNTGNEHMRIDSVGRVLINTTSSVHSTAKLQVVGDASSFARVALKDADGTSNIAYIDKEGAQLGLTSQNGTSHGTIALKSYNGTSTLSRLSIDQNGAITFNSAYTFPNSDGSANQVLQTDGSGNLSFATVSGGGGVSISNNADNRVLTGDGSNANAEANLLFNGSTLTVTGTTVSTGQITTGYGLYLTGGNTNFLLYNNTNDNLLYMRDQSNGQMLTTWYTNKFLVNKILDVTGDIQKAGTTIMDSSRNLTNIGTISSGAITSSGRIKTTNGLFQADEDSQKFRQYHIETLGGGGSFLLGKIENSGSTDGGVEGVVRFAYDFGSTTNNCAIHFNFAQRSGTARGTWWYEHDDQDGVADRVHVRLIDDGAGNMYVWVTCADYAETFIEANWRHGASIADSGTLSSGTLTTGTTLFDTANDPTSEHHIGKLFAHDNVYIPDSKYLLIGDGEDLQLQHNGSHSYIRSNTGDLYIRNNANDKDIIFQSEDGSGGVTTYFTVDGSARDVVFNKDIKLNDNVVLHVGTGNDLQILHDTANANFNNYNGDLYFTQRADDKDIIFRSDDGSGGIAEYLRLDGGIVQTVASKHILFNDNVQARFGDAADLQILHDASDSFLINNTGDLYIRNNTDDKDILIQTDNGSGGTVTYMNFDGSNERIVVSKSVTHSDNVRGRYGASNDLQIYHDATDSRIENSTGDLYFVNKADDKDIIFQSDNGSGGIASYFSLDGSNARNRFHRNVFFGDGIRADFGDSSDLQIYHDGSNSYIRDLGTGNLRIDSTDFYVRNSAGTELKIAAVDDGAVTLYYDGSAKLGTKSDGVDITGELQSDSLDVDGAADISGNLTIGGNLTVNGTTVTNSATNTTIEDALIELGSGNTGANANDLGLILERGTTGDNVFIGWDESTDRVAFATTTATGASTGALTLTDANIQAGRLYGNVTGDVTGNADTATTAGTVTTAAQPNITSLGTLTTLTVDDITINGSTISDGGTLTIDAGGDLILDAAGNDILLKDGGTEFGRLSNSSLSLQIFSPQSNADINFVGNDDGSTITALRLDMSNAGTAIFNNDVNIDGNELTFTSDAASAYIRGADALLIQSDYNTGENKPIYLQPSATTELTVATGQSTFVGNVDVGSGLDVTGNITVTGTVDGVDIAARDHDAVTLANTNYLSLSGQQITGGTVPISSGGTGATSASAARTALGVDAAGTDNSTNVTLTGTPDYITISGQTITRNQIDLTSDVTGVLPSANLDADTAHLSGTQTFSGVKTFNDIRADIFKGSSAPSNSFVDFDDDNSSNGINGVTLGSVATMDFIIDTNNNGSTDVFVWGKDGTNPGGANYSELMRLDSSGNLTLSGTVDGRDIATDGTKLDTIDTNADVTPSWVPSSDPGYLTSSSTQSKYLRSDTADSASSKITFNSGIEFTGGSIDYLPDTGAILKVDGQTILERMTANGALTFGHDDAVIIAGGDTSGVLNNNITNANEAVYLGAEGGVIMYAFPNNDITWSNRKSFSFDGANGLNMNSVFTVDINGNLSATTKSFDIPHPSKEGMRLRHGVLEGPENGVYVRGKSKEKVISLPEYWPDLIHEDSITVQLTAIGGGQELYVEKIEDNKVYVNGENYFYYIQAERKDVERFEVEYEG